MPSPSQSLPLIRSHRPAGPALLRDALDTLSKEVLPEYLAEARWYAAKEAGRPRVVVADTIALGAPAHAQACIVQAEVPGRSPESYFLPVVADWSAREAAGPAAICRIEAEDREGWILDAFADDAAVRAILRRMVEASGPIGGLSFHRTSAMNDAAPALLDKLALKWVGGEQSNSSVMIGDVAILKGFRKLAWGIHPEVEMGRYLTEVAKFAHAPPLLGWAEYTDRLGRTAAICVLQRKIANKGDGWTVFSETLARRFRETGTAGPGAFGSQRADTVLLDLATHLGTRTAELHVALAAQSGDPAFHPIPAGPDSIHRWRAGTHAMANRAVRRVGEAKARIKGEAARLAGKLLADQDRLMGWIDTARIDAQGTVQTRFHGDYHLGQVLISDGGNDAYIIDFEGEPLRSLDERRAKSSPLRDVAGMLRSFAYVAANTRMSGANDDASIQWLAGWESEMQSAFLDAYLATAENCPSLPRSPAGLKHLIDLFVMEKALYEVLYELGNRPHWLAIPLEGVLSLLETASPQFGINRRAAGNLDKLTERMGIEPTYRNAKGETVTITPRTERRLLGAMGVDAYDDKAAARVLAEMEGFERKTVSPVLVMSEDQTRVEVDLPWGASPQFRLDFEQGGGLTGMVQGGAIHFDAPPPTGYHVVTLAGQTSLLIVAPTRCFVPPGLEDGSRKLWGLSVQLYLLRSENNWGIGDFTDLKALVRLMAPKGTAVIGLNPLHAGFLDAPEHASPYSPASRLFLNVLYIDVTAIPEFAEAKAARDLMTSPDFRRQLEQARASRLVDYTTVTRLKHEALTLVYRHFVANGSDQRRQLFADFRRSSGRELERFCIFQALRRHMHAQGKPNWHDWPRGLQDSNSASVRRFAKENAGEVYFHAWCQWIADQQLALATAEARAQGMAIGLYTDLAVGADSAGAETWTDPKLVVSGAHVGAPPDILNPAGQDWGLPPFDPHRLRESRFAGFISLVRANMRHAGGLRIDHAMALQHTFWVPAGRSPAEGAYVRYPMDELLAILKLESHRHRCMVVGEDLGTVPEGFRERMVAAGILSYRVLFFEQDEETGVFVEPGEYPGLALATIGSHDLPTLRSWWTGTDIDQKDRLGLYPQKGEAEHQRSRRERDRARLLEAMAAEGLAKGDETEMTPALEDAIHRFLHLTHSGLAMAQLDDVTEEIEPVNIPGIIDTYPVWRRKMSVTLEELADDPRLAAFSAVFGERSLKMPD